MLADGLGFAAPLGAFGAALVFSARQLGARPGRDAAGRDSVVAIVLVGCLAAGVILASDVFGSGANVETLLFGSLLLVDGGDIALAAVAAVATAARAPAGRPPLAAARLRPGRRGRPVARRALSTPLLLGLIALATHRGALGGRRAAGRRALRRPGRDRAAPRPGAC